MDNLIIQQLRNKDRIPWDLLLLADPSKEKIQEYLHEGKIYVTLLDNKIIGEYILMETTKGVIELKNIAVTPKYQGQGIGKQLIFDAINRARNKKARRIEVGTGNSSLQQLAFYKNAGFKIIGVDKGFFLRNYKEAIIENGIRCADMLRLAINF